VLISNQAIRHAIEFWKVDTISMSFGSAARWDKTHSAILSANSQDIAMFAAAPKHRREPGAKRPCREDEMMCMNSTDAYGNGLHF
jgi:hypothetical protein